MTRGQQIDGTVSPVKAGGAGRFRWVICIILFLITVNNYMDRQLLAISAPALTAEFRLNNSELAGIANAFLIAYTVGQVGAGVFLDWIGARAGFTYAVATWSLTAMATALSRGLMSLSICRFILGGAEAVNYPGGVKVCAEWFPPNELATAVGIYQSGSSVGAMIAPITAALLITRFGWRAAFFVVAIPGLLWIPLWRRYYRPVESNPNLGEPERQYILSQRVGSGKKKSWHAQWSTLLRKRIVWAVALARFFEEPAAWFYFTWLPLYLKNHHAVPLLKIGLLLLIPFLTFDFGKVAGGWASSLLLKSGYSLNVSRKAILLISALCLMASIPATFNKTPLGFVLLISIATLGHGSWTTTAQTIPADIVPPEHVGTVYGITAFGGGLGGVIFTQLTGKIADVSGSFTLPLLLVGVLPIVGFLIFAVLAPRIEPIEEAL
jgi:ACS family hexuronate transporter-like MFS transporter